MKAIIMAGGEGTRLRPLTLNTPKPMVKVLDKPMLEYIIDLLKSHGIYDINITLMYLPGIITDYFKDGSEFGVNINYFKEDLPLGTAGSVKYATKDIEEDFLVISGDCITDCDLKKAIDFHYKNKGLITIVLKKVENPYSYGIVVCDENNRITKFLEKPSPSETFTNTVNTGIYIVNKRALSYFDYGIFFDFSKDLFPILLKNNELLIGYETNEYWCDVGDIYAYYNCHRDILNKKVSLKINGTLKDKEVILGNNSLLEIGAMINPPIYIGENTFVEAGAELEAYSVIGSNCVISKKSKINGAVISSGCFIGKNAIIDKCVLSNSVKIKTGAKIDEYSVIGEDTIIGEHTIVKPNIKIWPNKHIENGQIITKSIINNAGFPKSPFGAKGIEGEVGVDFNPENIANLGACLSCLYKNGKTAVACDESSISYMMKSALISGIMSGGGTVLDLGVSLIQVLRHAISFYSTNCGVYISYDSNLRIEFLDFDTANIDRTTENKLERLLKSDDFARVNEKQVKPVISVKNISEYYYKMMSNKFSELKDKKFIYYKSDSSLVYEYINELSKETGITPINLKEKAHKNGEISALIYENCEKTLLTTEDGDKVLEDQFYMLVIKILSDKNKIDKFVLPPYASDRVVEFAKNNSLKVITSNNSNSSLMKEIIKEGLLEQFLYLYDGVYATLKICEYCSVNNVKLSELVNSLPKVYKTVKKVDFDHDKRGEVMNKLALKHKNNCKIYEGIKITDQNGWAFIIPDNAKFSFTIITEGFNEEYSNELCDLFLNEVTDIKK